VIEAGTMDANNRIGQVLDDLHQQLVELAPDAILVHDGDVILSLQVRRAAKSSWGTPSV
jgi:hypothetical protein